MGGYAKYIATREGVEKIDDACYDLGRTHLMGQGCEEDEEEAQRWFRDALEAFHVAEASAEKKGYLRYRMPTSTMRQRACWHRLFCC